MIDMCEDADLAIVILSRNVTFENMVFSVFADHIADKNASEVPQYLSVVSKYLLADSIAGVTVLPAHDCKGLC